MNEFSRKKYKYNTMKVGKINIYKVSLNERWMDGKSFILWKINQMKTLKFKLTQLKLNAVIKTFAVFCFTNSQSGSDMKRLPWWTFNVGERKERRENKVCCWLWQDNQKVKQEEGKVKKAKWMSLVSIKIKWEWMNDDGW